VLESSARMSDPIRVVLVEDHQIVRQGLRALLEGTDDVVVIAEADNGHDGVEIAKQHRPDVVVMDLNLPGLNGVDATKAIRQAVPEAHVLILSMYSTEEHVRPAIRAGAEGYLLKGSGLSDLVAAIKAVSTGNAFFSPQVAKIVLDDSRRAAQGGIPDRAGSELTPRERQILKLVAEGRSSPEIAKDLNLSVKTVEGHRGRIMAKLDTKNVAGLVRHAIRLGLVSADM
jgi:two-component system, NarL family, response regulator NreC